MADFTGATAAVDEQRFNIKLYKEECEALAFGARGELLKFSGADDRDVYNCSVPFVYRGDTYLFGRVENRNEWARSVTYLFRQCGDTWVKEPSFDALPLEDPFVCFLNGEIVLGGTHVFREAGLIKTYYSYFYRGTDLFRLHYFTSGPKHMKDIRLLQLDDGKIGVFSRPRGEEILARYGCESLVGYTETNSLDELTSDLINNAKFIDNLFADGEWGGFNQAFLLTSGMIGAIGHQCYNDTRGDVTYPVYVNTAYVFNPKTNRIVDRKVLATRGKYPDYQAKLPTLSDCAFTSGIVVENGVTELYSGLSDCAQGKLSIQYPFENFGKIKY